MKRDKTKIGQRSQYKAHSPPLGSSFFLRLILCAALIVGTTAYFGGSIVEVLLPELERVVAAMASDYRVRQFVLDRSGPDLLVRVEVVLRSAPGFMPSAPGVEPGLHFGASTLVGGGLIAAAVSSVLLVAWPARLPVEHLLRWALAIPMIALVTLLDIPAVLSAQLQEMLPHGGGRSAALPAWKTFLLGGGRHAIGLAIASIAIVIASNAVVTLERSSRRHRESPFRTSP